MIECERFKITRQQQTFCTLGCLCLLHYKHLCSWRGITWTIYAHQKDRERSHFKTEVPDVWKVDIRTISWDVWSKWNYLGRFCVETIIFDWWWRSHRSLAHNGLRIFRFCVLLWKDKTQPNIKFCLGGQFDVVQKFTRTQSFGQNWRSANGIRVEHFPRIHCQVDEQPTKRSKKYDDKSAVAMLKKGDWQERESVTDGCHDRPGKLGKRGDKQLGRNSSKRQLSDARQLGCVFQDMMPPKSILRKSTDMPKPIQRVKFKKAIARHTKIRDQNPSLGYICPGEPHERSPMLQNLRIVHRKRQCGRS